MAESISSIRRLGFAGLLGGLALLPFAPVASSATSRVPSTIFSSTSTSKRVVALTFDDGPSRYTAQILNVLKQFHAHATFFLVGEEVAAQRQVVRDEMLAGDNIGDHTYTHADLQYLPNTEVYAELAATQNVVRSTSGTTPHWFRPPYGAVDPRVAGIAASLGLRTILWSVDPRDWSLPGSTAIATRVLGTVRDGSVVILHDGGGDRSETVEALFSILASLRAEGFEFDTLDQLFGLSPLCNAQRALHAFSGSGISARPTHAIYRAWQGLYCRGRSLGPAGNGEYRVRFGVVAQDFPATAHRLVWHHTTGQVSGEIVWPWATRVFAARGIQPAWHTSITAAWFRNFFSGRDYGPALSPAVRGGKGVVFQRFARRWCIERNGQLSWAKSQLFPRAASAPRSGRRGMPRPRGHRF